MSQILAFEKDRPNHTARPSWRNFVHDGLGQDLAEWCLITALISLIALGIFWRVSGGLQGGWGMANTTLTATNDSMTPDQGVAAK